MLRLYARLPVLVEEERFRAILRAEFLSIATDCAFFAYRFKADGALQYPENIGCLIAMRTSGNYRNNVYQTAEEWLEFSDGRTPGQTIRRLKSARSKRGRVTHDAPSGCFLDGFIFGRAIENSGQEDIVRPIVPGWL
jgi:hypothetical protein